MFDRSPLGLNHWLGFRFRCMLGRHIFKHLGKGVKIFHNVEFTYGYNLTIEEGSTSTENVLLDDRGETILHEGTSVSDYAGEYLLAHPRHRPQADVTDKEKRFAPAPESLLHTSQLPPVPEAGYACGRHEPRQPGAPATVAVGIPAKVKRQKDPAR